MIIININCHNSFIGFFRWWGTISSYKKIPGIEPLFGPALFACSGYVIHLWIKFTVNGTDEMIFTRVRKTTDELISYEGTEVERWYK